MTTLGRDPGCDVVLTDAAVSRRHARIVRRGGTYTLEDLGSTGGTLLNGTPLHAPARLNHGDRIEIGGCRLIFSDPDVVPQTWTAPAPTILSRRGATEADALARLAVQPEAKLGALLEITRSLAGTPGWRQVLENVLDALLAIFPGAERGLVLLADEDGADELVPAAVRTRREEPASPVVSRAIAEYVLAEGQAVLSEDVATDIRFLGSRSAQEARIRSLICAPLRDPSRRPAGVLQLDTGDPQARFTEADLDLLAAVASQVAMAVNNARSLERSRREQRRLELLAEAGAVLGSSLDAGETMRAMARLVVPELADLCLVDLRDESGEVRRVAAMHAEADRQPLVEEILRRYPPDPEGPEPAMACLRSGRPVSGVVDDAGLAAMTRDAEHLALARRLGVRSYECLPLTACGRTLGVLSLVATGDRRPIDSVDRLTAEALARRAALAVDNARLYREAQEASRAKDRFLAVLSHELRTPLTPVLLAASALLEGGAAPSRSTLEMIRRNVELEARLIDDLLDVARIGRGDLRLEREVLDAHESIRQAVGICRQETEAAGLTVELDLAAANSHVPADHTRLLQVSWNLICNAARCATAGSTLTIRTSNPSEGELAIEFRDTGVGIEPALLARIFEPFVQGEPAPHGRRRGLGLGLAISRAIAQGHGGRLTAESPGRGRGATFRLELPTAPVRDQTPGVAEPPTSTRAVEALRILLVEDNRDTLRYLAMVLRARGHDVVEAADLAQARAAAASGRDYDLLISDIELPDGTGLELMREMGGSGAIAGVAMSGYGSQEDVGQSHAAGFVEHLTKPVDLATLEAAIRRACAARGLAP